MICGEFLEGQAEAMSAGKRSMQRVFFRLGQVLLGALVAVAAYAGNREEAKLLFREGNGLLDQGHFAKAVAAYDRALEQDPQYVEAYFNRALGNEMVDRQKAIQDWRKFLEVAGDSPDLKSDIATVKARLQILQDMPPLPEAMQPSKYVEAAGDYYRKIAGTSDGEKWLRLPVKVFMGSAPEIKWQQGAREAYDIWRAVFPLELVALPERADIRMGWEESVQELGHAGEEDDWVQVRRVGDQITGRRVAVITVDLSRRWSKDEMRAIILHEMGHALGIKSHSDSRGDIMYWQIQEKSHQIPLPVGPYPLIWKSLVKQPSQRDINTLVRLYNSAGLISRFE